MSLLKACADGNLHRIKVILRSTKGRHVKVQERDNHNWTCLHHAVKNGNIECVKYLLTIKELDTIAETYEGETALQLACSIPNVPLEMVFILLEANKDLVNFVNNEEVDALQYAIMQKRLDVVKLLIDSGAPANHLDLDGDTALHIASRILETDIVRYLIYETDCDPNICNEHDKTAAFIFFVNLLNKLSTSVGEPHLTADEVECFEELARFTYDENVQMENQALELFYMMDYCCRLNHLQMQNPYERIVKIFFSSPMNPRHYFAEKILQAHLPSNYCLIALVHEMNEKLSDDRFRDLHSYFFQELFTLFIADESFFNEYIAEVMSTELAVNLIINEITWFRDIDIHFTEKSTPQKLFTFIKVLILYEIDFVTLAKLCSQSLPSNLYQTVLNDVFVPLSAVVNAPLEVYWIFQYGHSLRGFVIPSETKQSETFKVVSLKNLCRASIRRYYCQNYSHYNALVLMYSLCIPTQLRNFVCYNSLNFQF